jgi:uncharacterized protein DUF1707
VDEPSPRLRASDADRERVVFTLQTAVSEGRLTLEEFDQRVASVYAAKTHGELAAATSDLPVAPAGLGRVEPGWRGRPPAYRTVSSPVIAAGSGWGTYLSASLACLVIWACIAATGGGLQDFWFLWVAGPWGAVLASREISRRLR